MSLWRDFECEMQRLPLDLDTADRLLAGHVLPADAPPGYEAVASLLNGLRAHEEEVLWHEDTVPELVSGGRSPLLETMSTPRRSTLHRFKLAGTAIAAALACTTGLAFAGSLPGAAQDVASSMLAKVGVTVPGPNEKAGTHPNVRGTSSPDVAVSDDADQNEAPAENGEGKGAEISELATTTELTGVEKGAAISTLASGGKSQAGQQGEATADHSAATEGAPTADEASGGHSTAGTDNAAASQAHRP
jgi:hypothetical protein